MARGSETHCDYCGKSDNDVEICPHCKNMSYCSEEHKLMHYFGNKTDLNAEVSSSPECFPYKFDYQEDKGRCVVATRSIQPGEVVLLDVASIVGPSLTPNPVCLECLREFRISDNCSYPECSSCGFPLCESSTCQFGKWHKLECKILSAKKSFFEKDDNRRKVFFATGFLTTLRLLLKSKDVSYQRENDLAKQLMSHQEERRNDADTWQTQNTTLYLPRKHSVIPIRNYLDLASVFDDEEIQTAVGLLRTNSSRLESGQGQGKGLGLFPIYSRVNHSCLYNAATKKTALNGEFFLRLVSTRLINEGEEIFTHYVSPVMGTFQRQTLLQSKWYFTCKCRRCLDASEFGTFSNGLKCPTTKSCSGILLPEDPTDLKSSWRCTVCSVNNSKYSVDCSVIEQSYYKVEKAMRSIDSHSIRDQEKICFLAELLSEQSSIFYQNNGCLNAIREKMIVLLKVETTRLRKLADAESEIESKADIYNKIMRLKLQQVGLTRQFTTIMQLVDTTQNFAKVLNKVDDELKEIVQCVRSLKSSARKTTE